MPSLPKKHNAHKRKAIQSQLVAQRQSKRYYPTYHKVWKAHRETQLNKKPMCEDCKQAGIYRVATEVDHINGRADRREDYRPSNYQSLCKSCHSKKTRRSQLRGMG